MATCVPIKELKNTTTFAKLVEESPEEVIVTKNGYEAFAVMSLERLEALKTEAARAELYRLMDEAEADVAAGRVVDARKSQAAVRERYGL